MRRSETERLLLQAAETILECSKRDPFEAISFRRVAHQAAFSEATVRKHFRTREKFSEKLIAHILEEGVDPPSRDRLNGLSERLADRSERLADIVLDFTESALRSLATSRRFAAQFRLWNSLDYCPSIQARIAAGVEQRDHHVENFLNKFFSEHADVMRRRATWLTPPELASILGALLEGLAIRTRTAPSQAVSVNTVAKVVGLLLAASIEIEDCEHGPLEALKYIDEMRAMASDTGEDDCLW